MPRRSILCCRPPPGNDIGSRRAFRRETSQRIRNERLLRQVTWGLTPSNDNLGKCGRAR